MIAMIFEFWMNQDDQTIRDYTATSIELRELLGSSAGFRGVERFESCSEPGKFVAIGFFDDERAVRVWRTDPAHRNAQQLGRDRFFSNYRLRMCNVIRDYGPGDRSQAPADSNKHHITTLYNNAV